jgi:hypothetical protein
MTFFTAEELSEMIRDANAWLALERRKRPMNDDQRADSGSGVRTQVEHGIPDAQDARSEEERPRTRRPVNVPTAYGYAVSITQVENGFTIQVGCKTFVMPTLNELLRALNLYYTDPKAAEVIYCRHV